MSSIRSTGNFASSGASESVVGVEVGVKRRIRDFEIEERSIDSVKRRPEIRKVYVSVELRHSEITTRRRLKSTDNAGIAVCIFTGNNVSRSTSHINCEVHFENSDNSIVDCHEEISTYTARDLHQKIISFMAVERRADRKFVGPAYTRKVTKRNDDGSFSTSQVITDTQLYVSGTIEKDETSWNAALRELREEIGLDPVFNSEGKPLCHVERTSDNMNIWYHIVV